MAQVHPSALVAPGAQLADDVRIGPFCVVGAEVSLGASSELVSHVVVEGRTRIGPGCRFFPFATAGLAPQDLKYGGEATELEIGEGTVVREHVTIHRGTVQGGGVTRIGRHCLLMVGVHVAHDCLIGDRVIMANGVTLAGHVEIGERAVLGGLSAVLQFVRIGHHAMIGGMSGVEQDVIPYGLVKGERAKLAGLNLVGLKRMSVERGDLQTLQQVYSGLFESDAGAFEERLNGLVAQHGGNSLARQVLDFAGTPSRHGLCQPRARHGR